MSANNKVSMLAIIFILLLSIYSGVNAQGSSRANIDHIENERFPLLEVYLSVTDVQGLPIAGLSNANFIVTENGQPVQDIEVKPITDSQQPVSIAIVIDTSGSMGLQPPPTPLQNAVSAAKSFISSLNAKDQVAIVGFAESPYIVQDFTTDRALTNDKLDALKPGGETTMYDGIVEAVNLLKKRSERKILVLIADGRDTGDGDFNFTTSMDEVSRWAIPMYPIGFGKVDRQELEQMAALTGGKAQIQPNSSELTSAFDVILRILREQYLVSFMSALPADAKEHELHITVNNQNNLMLGSATQSFIALPGEVTVKLPFQDGELVGGNILLKPDVLAPASLGQMDIQLDGSLLQTVLGEPFEYAWDSTTVSPGLHQFTFIVTDRAGNSGQASVSLDIQPPVVVNIIDPIEGEVLNRSKDVLLDISSLAGIAKVEFQLDGNIIQTVSSPPYTIEIKWGSYSKGPHSLKVMATDVNGFSGEQEIVVQAGGNNFWFLILVIGLGIAALGIPLGLRNRRRSASSGVAGKQIQPVLRQVQGQNAGQVWSLMPGEMSVGRRRTNAIQLRSSKASREHAVIRYENGAYVMYNLSQNNPPLVNNMQVFQKHTLNSGDIIQFGEDVFRYEQ